MITLSQCKTVIYFLVLMTFSIARCEDTSITIPLNKTYTDINREIFGNFTVLKRNSTLKIDLIANTNKKLNAVVIQVHSHLYNVTLYNNTLIRHSAISGTNIGLYGLVKPSPDTYYVVNKNSLDVKLYISVHGYTALDPIPGGCNMELPTPIAPYLQVSYTRDMVFIGAPAAKDPKSASCPSFTKLLFYRMYMYERNLDEDSYFESVRKMLTLEQIQKYGEQIPETEESYSKSRRWLSAYPGTGSVYVVVTKNTTGYAAYVPAVSYACSPLDGCEVLDDITSQLLCACLLFTGLFVCFLGHRFFKTEMFLVGFFTGIIITFILLSIWTDLDRPALLSASVLSGVFFGSIWLLLWWFYGIPVISVCLITLHLGFVTAAIVYFSSSDHVFLRSDIKFWSIFLLITCLTSLTLSSVTYISNILSCAVLGSYATVFALDHYMGSNLKYIVINTVRRAVVKNFEKAVLAPPFQWRDVVASLLWLLLATGGFLFQHYHNLGRPPFPPPPRSVGPLRRSDGSSGLPSYGTVETLGRRATRGVRRMTGNSRTDEARRPLLENED